VNIFRGPAFESGPPAPAEVPAVPAPPSYEALHISGAGSIPLPAFEPPVQAVPPSPPPPPVPPSPPPVEYDPAYLALRAELAAAQSQLAEERNAWQAEQARIKAESERWAAYEQEKREKELEAAVTGEGVTYNSLDPEDARKLAKALQGVQEAKYQALADQLNAQQRALLEHAKGVQSAQTEQRQKEFFSALNAAVPNFASLVKTPGYQEFLKAPFSPGLHMTNEAVLNQELDQGNIGYVVDCVKDWAHGKPNPADIAQVSSANTGHQVVPVQTKPDAHAAMSQRLELMRSGKLSREQFRNLKKQNEAAGPQLSV
jgi:hypothetical protein